MFAKIIHGYCVDDFRSNAAVLLLPIPVAATNAGFHTILAT